MSTILSKKEIFSTIAKKIGKSPDALVATFFEDYSTTGKHSKITIYAPQEHIKIIDEFLLSVNIVAEKEAERLIIKVA